MNIRVGCDVVRLTRFAAVLARTPGVRNRMFIPAERRGASAQTLAGIFAAKEAVMKALGLAAGSWLDIRIGKTETGRPFARFSGPGGIVSHDLSISHDGDYVVAVAVFII